MCGILYAKTNNLTEDKFRDSLLEMKHRGPDSPGNIIKVEDNYLGHNRLSILDLDRRSNQPYYSDDRKKIIIFNGEIYNFRELAKEYNIDMKTTSDTELLIELYIKIGKKCLTKLNGIFAFIIYDIETKQIFAARDRLGVKPLYIYQKNNDIVLSSEINAILKLFNCNDIDEFGFRQYRKLRTFFNGRTLYSNIKMFQAGSYYENGTFHKYWEFPDTKNSLPPTDEELYNLIDSSIKYRLVSDVPVGSYLSGGLDSTIVAGLSKTEHTWTVGSKSNNEFEYSKLAAKKFQSFHHEVLYENSDFLSAAKLMIEKRKEPLSVPNEVLLYLMTKQVKDYNTVILSGEGADELFFGYDRIFRWAENSKIFDIKEFSKLYSYGSVDDIEIVEDAIAPFVKYGRPIDIVAAFFQVAHLHGLLRRLDNSTMLCAVEAREPFVDYRLIERMAGVDFSYRMKDGIVKEPLKRIFKNIVPIEIIERKKVGFPVSLNDILPQSIEGDSVMDKWFNFNLTTLGITPEEVAS